MRWPARPQSAQEPSPAERATPTPESHSRSTSPAAIRPALALRPRSAAVLTLASVAGLMVFLWPFLLTSDEVGASERPDAPFVFLVILPILALVVLAELSEGGIDSKTLAMLGVLTAINAALRPLGAGIAGIETVFFMLVLAGRVYGPGFGFVLGCTSLFASALLTAGVGPWLPFQMLCSAWIGLGAGLLPRFVKGRGEIVMLIGYGIFAAYFFGFLMGLWFWPFLTGSEFGQNASGVAFVPGAPVLDNLQHYIAYTAVNTSLAWDTGRAITNSIAIFLLGPAVLATLRRAARKASYAPAEPPGVRDKI